LDQTEALLKEITEAPGVPGYEGEVRAVIRRHLEEITTIEQDKMGSIICKKAGLADSLKVMLAGHMDEIGFMVKLIKLRDLVIETAQELGIPLQFSAVEGGATDGGMIHIHAGGVPAVVIGVPTRHIHSHVGIMHRDDYDHALKLIVALVKKLDQSTVQGLTV
jgi:putative aminopeptidase FrvX